MSIDGVPFIGKDYNPVTGRYIQYDPIGFDGGVNGFAYVANNLIGAIDIDGLKTIVLDPGHGDRYNKWNLLDPLGNPVASSTSYDNNNEFVDFPATIAGNYTIQIQNYNLSKEDKITYAIAWTVQHDCL